ncbi:MAG TPA: glycosyltransferase, partial [Candidatus Dormibacteraeota bacterium]|nr:glycosyltransferase [Candidatus Dormibacteraeota bacterium]
MVITLAAVAMIGLTSIALFAFGSNLLYLTWRATRLPQPLDRSIVRGREPRVCVQVPIYNERYVAERVLDAVCEMEWPLNRFEVQVLDDSDDETASIVARRAAHWRRHGVDVTHVRRLSRDGFKAGALAHGMTLTSSPFIAIFDADFMPAPDFLRRTMGVFEDATVGFAQARWGHLDEGYSWFTRLQAFALDFHFLIEQAVRSSDGYFTNFTGTAGVWRRAAIEESGGWSADTLTEDLDLSYRAQLRGWRAAYLEDVVVPEELPVSFDAYRRQQSRWATGSFQSAFKLLSRVLRSDARPAVKLQATMHLLAYGVGPVMALQLACYPLLLIGPRFEALPWQVADAGVLFVMMGISPWVGFSVAQIRRGRPWWQALPSLLCQLVGAGMSFTVILALIRATRSGGEFVRTPKHQIVERGQEWRDQAYVRVGDPRAIGEAALGAASLAMAPFAAAQGQWLVAIYSTLFAIGFLTVSALTAVDFLEVVRPRGIAVRILARIRVAGPLSALMALCVLLLFLAAQMPEPFEDGYGHWLIAANLASTGQLKDPIFGMQDTWLPGYHVLAAAVLKLFGLWSLGALKVLSAGLGLATLAAVYAMAPSARQGRLAVVLLALNPVFLFTSGSAVVEPLMTALLTAGALAAVRGRMKLAATLAALACVTSTKSWIWVGAAVAFALVQEILKRFPLANRHRRPDSRAPRRQAAFAWGVPSTVLLVLMQLGFSPASHSLARGSVEALSATARGSIAGDAWGRLSELVGTFGLAALPLFALGAVGLAALLRKRPPESRGSLAFLHVPALAYLAAVVGLITVGAYTGSHRYLYPALPSLALLAAAALDQRATFVRLTTVAAGGLLAIAFLPVFMGFAIDNAGLVAAGRAASGIPGVLLTDSPVAAFFSGKPPSQLTGSQNLPADPAGAASWMRTHGVTALVLEDIGYYRATTIFPDPAAGTSTATLESLGNQATYQVASGKPVFAYRFGDGLLMQSIYPGVTATISPMPAQGKTAPLAKGLSLRVRADDAAGEGMGFGAPIAHYPDGWVYSRTATTVDLSTPITTVWKRTFTLDEIGGDAAHRYAFVPIASRGSLEVTYTVDATGVAIDVSAVNLAPGYTEVGILNEQSAAFDDFAEPGRTITGPAFGIWTPASGAYARLRAGSLGVEWSVPPVSGARLQAGRELSRPDFNWAGLDYIFSGPFTGTRY